MCPLDGAAVHSSSSSNFPSGGGAGGGLFNLIDTSLSAAPANLPDPWSTLAPITSRPQTATAAIAFIPPPPSSQAGFAGGAAQSLPPFNNTNNTNSAASGGLNILDDAWTPKCTCAQVCDVQE